MPRRDDTVRMTPSPRLIRLRRPAVIAANPGRFVPERCSIDEVDAAWSIACERNPRLFDGPLWHVAGVSRNGHGGVTIHVIESSYRFHAVRASGLETGIRPLGVKGIAWIGGRVLLGLRSPKVHAEPGAWEFIPGGTLEPGVDPAAAVERELLEEARCRSVRSPVAKALLFDDSSMTWEIVHRLVVERIPPREFATPPVASWEVSLMVDAAPNEVRNRPLTRAAELMLPLLVRFGDAGDAEKVFQ